MNASSSAANVRREYAAARLDEADVAADPIAQFTRWFHEALSSGFTEPTAMTLATVGTGGRPAARIVLLKGFDVRGFVFFTNFESRKGYDLATHPFAALLFHWVELERQVRIEGSVEKIAPSESDDYFATRPLGSRLGAWASPQSQVLPSRAWLEERLAQAAATHGNDPPRPAHWGGYRLAPEAFEFWQGRPNRLHDRIQYVREPDGGWRIQRLAP